MLFPLVDLNIYIHPETETSLSHYCVRYLFALQK